MSFDKGIDALLRDRNELRDKLAAALAKLSACEARVDQLSGIKPEFPPMPTVGGGLPRYGIRWNGPTAPLAVPMLDGYWTPWHLAKDQLAAANADRLRLYSAIMGDPASIDIDAACDIAKDGQYAMGKLAEIIEIEAERDRLAADLAASQAAGRDLMTRYDAMAAENARLLALASRCIYELGYAENDTMAGHVRKALAWLRDFVSTRAAAEAAAKKEQP